MLVLESFGVVSTSLEVDAGYDEDGQSAREQWVGNDIRKRSTGGLSERIYTCHLHSEIGDWGKTMRHPYHYHCFCEPPRLS